MHKNLSLEIYLGKERFVCKELFFCKRRRIFLQICVHSFSIWFGFWYPFLNQTHTTLNKGFHPANRSTDNRLG